MIYIYMPKNLSAKYYQKDKERLLRKARERYQNFSEKKKKTSSNMAVNVTKISQNMKKQRIVEY